MTKAVVFKDLIFNAQGTSLQDKKLFNVLSTGFLPLTFENCKFQGLSRTGLNLRTSGEINFQSCTFGIADGASENYNRIEGSISNADVSNTIVNFDDCTFNNSLTHNHLNFYKMANNGEINVTNCTFYSHYSSICRLSNVGNTNFVVTFKNVELIDPTDNHDMVFIFQDHGNGNPKQDFTKITLNLNNFRLNGEKVVNTSPEEFDLIKIYRNATNEWCELDEGPRINFK